MNNYDCKIAYYLFGDEHALKTVAEFKRMESIELLKHKSYIFDLFKAIDNIDTLFDVAKPDIEDKFAKLVLLEIKKVRAKLSILNFDREFLEEGGHLDDYKLNGNWVGLHDN